MNDMILTAQQSRTSGCEKNSFLFLCYIHAQSISFLIYYLERLFFAPEKSYTSRICQRGPYNRINLKVLSFILGERHTHKKEEGGELKRRLGNKKQQAKNWAFTNSLFVCVCFTPSTLQMWKKNTGTKKVESFERGLQGTYTHTQPENEGNREGKTTYPCRPHQVLRCPPIFSAFSLMQRSFVCVRTHHHAAHCCPATEAKVNSSNCKRGKQNKKGGDLRNELSVIRMRAIWNFEIGNTSPHFYFHVFLPFHSGLLHLHWRGRRCSITVLHIDSLGCCLEQLWGSSKVCSFLLFFPMALTCQTSGGVKTRVAPGVWPFKRRRRRKGPLIH